MEMNKKFWSIYPLLALVTPLQLISFTTEEITGCTDTAGKGANKAARNQPSQFVNSFFTISFTPATNTPESLMILWFC